MTEGDVRIKYDTSVRARMNDTISQQVINLTYVLIVERTRIAVATTTTTAQVRMHYANLGRKTVPDMPPAEAEACVLSVCVGEKKRFFFRFFCSNLSRYIIMINSGINDHLIKVLFFWASDEVQYKYIILVILGVNRICTRTKYKYA